MQKLYWPKTASPWRCRRIAFLLAAGIFFGGPISALELEAKVDRVEAPSSTASVRIYRDEWGVPHIYAKREEDGFFGLGYAQGEDELKTLLTIAMSVEGRAAAGLGKSAVDGDLRSLQWLHADEARKSFSRLSPQLRRNYSSYTDGLRHYMRTHPELTPAWASGIEPWTWLAWSRGVFWEYMVQDGLRDCAAGGAKLGSLNEDFLRKSRAGLMASNEWYLAPWRTAQKAPMILSDPHAEIDGSIFYEFQMHAGDMDVEGYTLGPLMLLTHNRDVAWGMTTGAPDVSDCYAIQVDPTNPRKYEYDGKPRQMIVRSAHVVVKDAPPVVRTFEYVLQNGVMSPVVARDGNVAYVVSTSYMNAAGIFDEEILRMNHARNIADIRAAHELMGMFPQNVMSGDRFGHSYYLRAGRTPRRPAGYDWTRPVTGNSSATAWLGVHAESELVHLADPPSGYMQNDNVPPYLMIGNSAGPSPKDYPDYIYYDTPVFRYVMRGARTTEVLSRAYAFTVDDAKALAVDDKWFGTERWLFALSRAMEHDSDTVRSWPLEARVIAQRLLAFDGHARSTSSAALAFFHWRTVLAERLSEAQAKLLDTSLVAGLPATSEVEHELVVAVASASAAMLKAYGTLDRAYGDVFRIGRSSERSWPVSGSAALDVRKHSQCKQTDDISLPCPLTLRAYIAGAPDIDGRRYITAGSRAMRLIVFTDPLQSYTMHNYGQSSDPESPHYDDQARELVSNGTLKQTHFSPESLKSFVTSTTTLSTRVP